MTYPANLRRTPKANTSSTLTRSPWGQKRRASEQAEKAFQKRVEDLAQYLGWYPWHCGDASKSKPGLPDLLLLREREVWIELKATSRLTGRTGKLSPNQIVFADMLKAAGREWYCIDDSTADWERLLVILAKVTE